MERGILVGRTQSAMRDRWRRLVRNGKDNSILFNPISFVYFDYLVLYILSESTIVQNILYLKITSI